MKLFILKAFTSRDLFCEHIKLKDKGTSEIWIRTECAIQDTMFKLKHNTIFS